MTTWLAATVAAALALIAVTPAAHADEGGVSFWVPGQYGSFAAIAPQPGFALPMVSYFYSGSAGASEAIPVGGRLELGSTDVSLANSSCRVMLQTPPSWAHAPTSPSRS